jgi:hypothetical protein
VTTTASDGAAINGEVARRGITTLRHFTTNAGVTGVLATGELRSRRLLTHDKYLDRIFYPNCETRIDPRWTGHVSISFTNINDSFFAICSGQANWHRDLDGFWAVLDISPTILGDDDVWFATTNLRYSNVSVNNGLAGLEALFAETVNPFRPIIERRALHRYGLADNQPTDAQAEALYPDAVPTKHLTAISVRTAEDAASVSSQVGYFAGLGFDVGHIEVRVDPAVFTSRPVGLGAP